MIPNKPAVGHKFFAVILACSLIPVMLMAAVSIYSFASYHNNMGKDISLTISMIERVHPGKNPELIYMLDDMGKKSEAMSTRYKTLIIIISLGALTTALLAGLLFIKNADGKRRQKPVLGDMNTAYSSNSLEKDLIQLRDNIDLLIQMLNKIK